MKEIPLTEAEIQLLISGLDQLAVHLQLTKETEAPEMKKTGEQLIQQLLELRAKLKAAGGN